MKATYVMKERGLNNYKPVLQIWSGDWFDSGHTGSGRASIEGVRAPTFTGESREEVRMKARAWKRNLHHPETTIVQMQDQWERDHPLPKGATTEAFKPGNRYVVYVGGEKVGYLNMDRDKTSYGEEFIPEDHVVVA